MCNAWCIQFLKDSFKFWPASPQVLEVGALDVNGSIRPVCEPHSRSYIGVDIEEGSGVDAVVDANKLVEHFGLESFDVVISTEMVEHVYDWPNVFYQMMAVLKKDGLLILTTRSVGFEVHDHPSDYWRYSRSDMSVIFENVGDILSVADDMTLGYSCGVGIAVRKKATIAELETWKQQLSKSHRLYSVVTSTGITFENYRAHKESERIPQTNRQLGVSGLLFDQYQRYRIIQEVIDSLRWKPTLDVLDVGGSPATLIQFLPQDNVMVMDVADQGGLGIYGDGLALPFRSQSFDIVVTSDTLEHVPPADRSRFLAQLGRVAREAVIIGAPFDDPAVVQAEEVLQSLILARYGESYHFLDEHRTYGLPKLDPSIEFMRSKGFNTAILPNGYLHRWLVAISTLFLLQWRFHDPELNARVSAYYNQNFYRTDNRDPSYRKIIVAAKTRDISGLYDKLCIQSPATEEDRIFHLQVLDMLMHTLTEGWSTRALTLQDQLVEKEQAIRSLSAQLMEKEPAIQALSAQMAERQQAVESLTAQVTEKDKGIQFLSAQVAERQQAVESLTAQVAERQQAVESLTAQVAEKDQSIQVLSTQVTEKEQVVQAISAQLASITSSTGWALLQRLWRVRLAVAPHGTLRERLLQLGIRVLRVWRREGVVAILRKVGTRIWRSTLTSAGSTDSDPPAGVLQRWIWNVYMHLRPVGRVVLPYEWRSWIVGWMRRHVGAQPRDQVASPVVSQALQPEADLLTPSGTYDIVCFPVIDWHFRFQRPQQLLTQFARDGHRVFYIRPSFLGVDRAQAEVVSLSERIYELALPGRNDLTIYQDQLTDLTLEKSCAALREFICQYSIAEAVCLVQFPFWQPLAQALKAHYGWKIVYDCMDDHSGFTTNRRDVLAGEAGLVDNSDLVIVTSQCLYQRLKQAAPNCILVPNAGDYAHFSNLPSRDTSPLASLPRPVIGYYGAIAEWFDSEAIRQAAARHPDWSFVLIGRTFGSDLKDLAQRPNIHLLDEKPYAELPAYLAGFDVCTIPFLRIPLTEATNPVKVFEYLSAGKPVVVAALPELESLADLVYRYTSPEQFVDLLEQAWTEDSLDLVTRRQATARQNTWEIRYQALKPHVESLYGKVSIVVVTWNNLDLTRQCLDSVLADQTWPNLEVIVVDNASDDGTVKYLKDLTDQEPRVQAIFNETNLGFAAANNIGLRHIQDSKFVVLLNNDTIVPKGWLARLLRYARQPDIGMVGPETNWAGNEAQIEVSYRNIQDMEAFARAYVCAHDGAYFDIEMLAMFCVAMRKTVVDQIGLLDERFGLGMFEDDDYAHRMRQAGYRVVCAEDVFVHHWGKASFSRLNNAVYDALFERNRQLYEEKWGEAWVSHQYRPSQK